jgi:hypothetical protein
MARGVKRVHVEGRRYPGFPIKCMFAEQVVLTNRPRHPRMFKIGVIRWIVVADRAALVGISAGVRLPGV